MDGITAWFPASLRLFTKFLGVFVLCVPLILFNLTDIGASGDAEMLANYDAICYVLGMFLNDSLLDAWEVSSLFVDVPRAITPHVHGAFLLSFISVQSSRLRLACWVLVYAQVRASGAEELIQHMYIHRTSYASHKDRWRTVLWSHHGVGLVREFVKLLTIRRRCQAPILNVNHRPRPEFQQNGGTRSVNVPR